MDNRDNEPNLLDFIEIAWKRKWLIVLPALLLALAAGVLTSLLKPQWEVDAVILPGRFSVPIEPGGFQEIAVAEPKQIVGQINQGAYDLTLAAELGLDPREMPRLRAEAIRDTKLVKVAARTNDTDRARRVLASLFVHLKAELDRRTEVEFKTIDAGLALKESAIEDNLIAGKDLKNTIAQKELEIEDRENRVRAKENEIKKTRNEIKIKELEAGALEIEKERLRLVIEVDRNKLGISEARVADLGEEMKDIKARAAALDGQLQAALGERKRAGDAVGMLLYSNEVQQSLRYHNTLAEQLSAERVNRENLLLAVRDRQEELRQVDNRIAKANAERDNLEAAIDDIETGIAVIRTEVRKIGTEIERVNNDIEKIGIANGKLRTEMALLEQTRGRIDTARLVKEPTASLDPVFPRKPESVLVAGLLGLIGFTGLAILVDRLQARSRQRVAAADRPGLIPEKARGGDEWPANVDGPDVREPSAGVRVARPG